MMIYTAGLDNEVETEERPKFSSGPSSVASDARPVKGAALQFMGYKSSVAGVLDWDISVGRMSLASQRFAEHELMLVEAQGLTVLYSSYMEQMYGLFRGRRYSSPLLEIWSEPDQDQELAAILQEAALTLPAAWRSDVLQRIAFLAEDEEDDSESLSMSSLEAAIQFLSSCPKLKRPSLFVAPNGNFRAEWHDGPKSLGIEFSAGNNARYILLKPRPNSHVIEKYSGFTRNENVLAQLYQQGVTRWILEK